MKKNLNIVGFMILTRYLFIGLRFIYRRKIKIYIDTYHFHCVLLVYHKMMTRKAKTFRF